MKSAHKTLEVFAIFHKWTLWIEKLLGFSPSSVPPEKKRTVPFKVQVKFVPHFDFFQDFDPKVKLRGTPVGDKNQQLEFECPKNVQSDLTWRCLKVFFVFFRNIQTWWFLSTASALDPC